jgi:putative aldouronate transport system permease protein
VLKNFFEAIPKELYESAKIDGANEFISLFRIFVPLSTASIAALGLFYTMGHWNSYLLPSIYLNDVNKYPLQVVLKNMLISDQASTSSDVLKYSTMSREALKNATIFISIIPMIILYPFVQKYFVKGVMLGAVKG